MPHPLTIPPTGTARRPEWASLPVEVRAAVQRELGATVTAATSQRSGYTPGFASRLRLADGRRRFVKATGPDHPWLVEAYRTEADRLRVLPAAVPAPRLESVLEVPTAAGLWVVLVLADVEGRPPVRPWTRPEAVSALATVALMSRTLTPAPAGRWDTFCGTAGNNAEQWTTVRELGLLPDLVDELSALAARAPELAAGTTLVHSDVRDDNLIIATDGRVWVCDWNFPTLGPVWADAVCLAISCHGDGLDADALLADTGLVGPDDAKAIDAVLALLLGYFCCAGRLPSPATSPHLRAHQRWYAAVVEDWLRLRRDRPGRG